MKVSILTAAYNVRDFIERAVASAKAQTMADWEMLVIDDASTDGTPELVEDMARADPRIRLLRQDQNRGPSAARNRAIEAARGEWVAVLDADDAWRPERLERLLAVADETGADFVADDLRLFDAGLGREVGVAFERGGGAAPFDAEALFAHENPLRLGLMKPLMRRSLFAETGQRYEEGLRSAEDFLLYAELLLGGARAAVTGEAYYIYTMRVGPVSGQKAAGSRSTTSAADLLSIAERLERRHGEGMTPRMRDGLRRFRRVAEGRRTSGEITRLRQSRDYLRLVLFLIGNPSGTIRYVRSSPTLRRVFGAGRS